MWVRWMREKFITMRCGIAMLCGKYFISVVIVLQEQWGWRKAWMENFQWNTLKGFDLGSRKIYEIFYFESSNIEFANAHAALGFTSYFHVTNAHHGNSLNNVNIMVLPRGRNFFSTSEFHSCLTSQPSPALNCRSKLTESSCRHEREGKFLPRHFENGSYTAAKSQQHHVFIHSHHRSIFLSHFCVLYDEWFCYKAILRDDTLVDFYLEEFENNFKNPKNFNFH